MNVTSASLLERVRHDPQSPDWPRLVELYTPLVRNFLRRHEVLPADSDDLVQEVMAVVVRRLPEFEHNQRTGAFRNWLRTITANCLRDFWKAGQRRPTATGDSQFLQRLAELEDPGSGLSTLWNQEHDTHVTRQLLEMLRDSFETRTWQAFQRVALAGEDARQVADDLGLTTNAVFIAKSRVLSRLREEAAGLLDSD